MDHRRIGQGGVDMLSFAGALPMQQGEGHGVSAHEASAVVIDGIGLDRRLAVAAETALHTGRRLGKLLVTRPTRPGSEMPEGIE
jgi:hypothetical protein